jgi:hypothetical protein
MRAGAAALLAATLIGVPAAQASIWITNDATRPQLAVDAHGTVQVTWTAKGTMQAVLVPPKGQLAHGGALAGHDVSKRSPVRVPLALAVRRGPDGTLYALQQWQVSPNGPQELHLARWRGPLPKLKLAVEGQRLTGSATYQGRPLTGFSTTLEGKRLRIYAFLDCFGCPAAPQGWSRMIGVAPRADGTFRVLLRAEWLGKRYRATVAGPGYAPDAQVVIAA